MEEVEEKDKVDRESEDGKHPEVDSSSESDSEAEDAGEKRTREQLELDEVEALRHDLGEDLREGKRARRANAANSGETVDE
jgi:hypothetical protein